MTKEKIYLVVLWEEWEGGIPEIAFKNKESAINHIETKHPDYVYIENVDEWRLNPVDSIFIHEIDLIG